MINKLRYHSYKVLPLVYDDALSYLEILDKVRYKINEIIDGMDIYQIKFADPIYWDITKQYEPFTIVKDDNGSYISKQAVPAGISLTNQEYWQNIGETQTFTQTVINVADYGALGVRGADYTTQIRNAIEAGNILYFPKGYYSFGTIDINKDIIFFGDGEDSVFIPLHKNTENNAYKPMFNISTGNRVTFDGINITGDNSIVNETGDKEYTESIIRAFNSDVIFKDCYFNDLRSVYRLTVADIPFTEREGILLYASNCNLTMSGCTFGDFYGNELIWSSRSRNDFSNGTTIIENCKFDDRTGAPSGVDTDGSCFDILGGTILFVNNIGDNSTYAGSFANLFGDCVYVNGNNFTNFQGYGSMIDTCEGYYVKNSTAIIENNYFEAINFDDTIKVFSKDIRIANNYITGRCPIKILVTNDYSDLDTYHSSENLESDLNNIDIKNNTLVCTLNGDYYYNTGVVMGQTRQSAGSRSKYKTYNIFGNTFENSSDVTSPRQQLEILTNADIVTIANNIFKQSGTAQSGTRLAFIGTNDTASMKLILIGNYFAPSASACNVIFGSASGFANYNVIFASNSTEDTTNLHAGPSTMTATILSNNSNILT